MTIPGSARGLETPPRRHLLRLILILSLALNLILLGGLAGHRWHRFWHQPLPPSERLVNRIVSHVPPPARKALREALEDHRGELLAALGALRQAQIAKHEALGAEPFDPARLAAAYAEVRQKLMALHVVFGEAAVEAASHLSPKVRKELSRRHRGLY